MVRRLAVAALLVGLLIGGAVGWAASGDDTTNAAATPAPIVGGGRAGTQAAKPATAGEGTEDRSPTTAAAGATADEDLENVLARALNKGVGSATKRYDGTVEAAILADGWSTPVVRATSAGRTGVAHESSRRTRMWSMSKAVTAVALLERVPYGALAEPVKQAMTRALTASENCPQRRIVLELQRRYDGPGGAQEAVRKVLADAGADPTGVDVAATPPDDPDCQRALTDGSLGWNENPRAAALQLGTAEWTIGDAARFAHHLAAGGYTPRGAGKRVLQLLRLAKARSTEGDPSGFTAPLTWGAGEVFGGADPVGNQPAYKSGWGGTQSVPKNFVAGQIVALTVAGRSYGIAVYFHPAKPPTLDDPGQRDIPEALAAVLTPVAKKLRASSGG